MTRRYATAPLLARTAAAYLLLRLVSGVMIALASRHQVPFLLWTDQHVDYLDMTVLWDGGWYRRIAEHGYPTTLPLTPEGATAQNEWAFYPLFPALTRALMDLTGGSFALVGSSLSVLLGLLAAVLMVLLLRAPLGDGPALATTLVWAASPASPALQLAYTESLAMALLCAFLLAVQSRAWLMAGLVGVAIGLSRPIAVPLGAVLLVAAVVQWRRERGGQGVQAGPTVGRRRLLPPEWGWILVGLLGCLAGALVWPALAAWTTGVPDAYTRTMASWRASGTLVPVRPWLDMGLWLFPGWPHARAATLVTVLAMVALWLTLTLGPWARGLGPVLRTWCLAYPTYLVLVLDPYTSLVRYLLPLFPLAAVLVGVAGGGRARHWRARAGMLVLIGLVGQAVWIGELLVFVPPQDLPP